MPDTATPQPPPPATRSVLEVFTVFLRLGLTSFGGPVAHLGYFRTECVERRRWLDEARYADLVALCQFLPGPASSQVGMALGLQRAGGWGALAAWAGFTLPSALALVLFALGVSHWAGLAQSGLVHGLKVMAVAVVAQAVWGMAKSLCTDRARAGLAVLAALLVLLIPSTPGQLLAMALGALVGRWWLPAAAPATAAAAPASHTPSSALNPAAPDRARRLSRRIGGGLLLAFALLLVLLPAAAQITGSAAVSAIAVVYQAGSLVFGGGHVVLPLLQAGVVPSGWMSNDTFLAGYAAAQAVPGPLFTLAAYLGAAMPTVWSPWVGATALLLAIFVPAFLLVAGALPFWEALRQRPHVQRTLAGVNAAVVGLLAAALYDPVWTSAIHQRADLALALAAFGLLMYARLSPVWVAALSATGGWVLATWV